VVGWGWGWVGGWGPSFERWREVGEGCGCMGGGWCQRRSDLLAVAAATKILQLTVSGARSGIINVYEHGTFLIA
jgi:hypothetical protein